MTIYRFLPPARPIWHTEIVWTNPDPWAHCRPPATLKRVQRSRRKGARLPEGVVYVGRPTPWGNPWTVPRSGGIVAAHQFPGIAIRSRADAVAAFRVTARLRLEIEPDWLDPLRGHDLACWCPLDEPCHADVLLQLANRPEP